MTAQELIERLQKLPAERTVMILDGFNGGGEPREINMQGERRISQENADAGSDCEGMVGQIVTVFGYGCY